MGDIMASKWSISAVLSLVLLMGGLAISAASATSDRGASQATSGATVNVMQSRLGLILVDARGHSLYLYATETPSRILCTYDLLDCSHIWPPFLTQGKPRAGKGVNARLLGTAHRTKPAGLQVTYNGHPLYFLPADKKPGDVKGQAAFGAWWVVSPTGNAIKKR